MVRIFVAWLLSCSVSFGAEAVSIPLSEIWAFDMPGTKDIREVEPDRYRFQGMSAAELTENSLAYNTRWLLNANNRPAYGSAAERGFVVAGTGLEALTQANTILKKNKRRSEFFSPNDELTLVFFSYSCRRYVRLDEVTHTEKEVTVKYHFHAHGLRKSTTHFALIPLGKCAPAKITIHIVRQPDTSNSGTIDSMDQQLVRQTVCDSFSIGVNNNVN